MKIKKFTSKQILKLHLINSKIYEHNTKNYPANFLADSLLTQIITDFKKALYVIFRYHQKNKQILFLGMPKQLELKINKSTNHLALPSDFNLQGLFMDSNSQLSKTSKQFVPKVYKKLLLPKLSKRPNMIVLVSHIKKDQVMKEVLAAKIPLVTLKFNDNQSNSTWINHSYNLPIVGSNFASTTNLFFLGLNFLFNKSFKT